MPFQKVTTAKLSTSVVRQIELLILRGVLTPGDRLPSERDLAERLGVSRPSLRDALGELQERGLLAAKAGSGVYVADVLGSAFSPALVDLFARHDEAVFDYLSFRRDLEGLAAERAARMGSDEDLKIIQSIYDRMAAAQGPDDSEEAANLDAQFHAAIMDAGHNVVMLHMMRSMLELLHKGVFYNRRIMFQRATTRENLLAQHSAINSAIQDRNPAAARAAVEAHLDFVKTCLLEDLETQKNAEIARQKLEKAQKLGS
ncbi:FCD domain-containing protein [Epibacterium sp. SM1979]|uniref:Pyruvate dehydrogenase complex repressor n=1 Tax=Tritonibacter litoralis TaxID=2662264 RepID=A0A843YGS5_9RHOB|nr:FCD domain-containing protein [Tritonibacter litoralis]MQQ08644.1 FCD domain-containing protein [Tritonibacter litoralis]